MKKWFPEAFVYSPPGGRFGKAGMPDHLWIIKAADKACVVVCIEAKADGNEVTQIQMHTLIKLKEQGCICAIVTGKDEDYMMRIRDEVLRRIQLADEGSES